MPERTPDCRRQPVCDDAKNRTVLLIIMLPRCSFTKYNQIIFQCSNRNKLSHNA